MTAAHRHINMELSEFDNAVLDRFIFAVQGRMEKMFVSDRFITADKAMAELDNISESSFYKLVANGEIEQFFFKDFSTPFYSMKQIFGRLEQNRRLGYSYNKKKKQ